MSETLNINSNQLQPPTPIFSSNTAQKFLIHDPLSKYIKRELQTLLRETKTIFDKNAIVRKLITEIIFGTSIPAGRIEIIPSPCPDRIRRLRELFPADETFRISDSLYFPKDPKETEIKAKIKQVLEEILEASIAARGEEHQNNADTSINEDDCESDSTSASTKICQCDALDRITRTLRASEHHFMELVLDLQKDVARIPSSKQCQHTRQHHKLCRRRYGKELNRYTGVINNLDVLVLGRQALLDDKLVKGQWGVHDVVNFNLQE